MPKPAWPPHLMPEPGRTASPDISRMLSMFSPAQVWHSRPSMLHATAACQRRFLQPPADMPHMLSALPPAWHVFVLGTTAPAAWPDLPCPAMLCSLAI